MKPKIEVYTFAQIWLPFPCHIFPFIWQKAK